MIVGSVPIGTPQDASTAALGTSSVKLLDAVEQRRFLFVQNLSASASVAVNFGAGAMIGAGSIVLQAGQSLMLQVPGFVPNSEVYACASAAGTGITVKAF